MALGCLDAGPREAGGTARALVLEPTCQSQTLSWGQGDAELGLDLPGPDRAARGPLAVSLRGGDTLLLDNQRGRLVRVDSAGLARTLADNVDPTAEDLAVGPTGAVAAFSPLRGQVSVWSSEGTHLGNVKVPRSLRHVARVELGSSNQVFAFSPLQERHSLGSPTAPMALGSVLRSNVEGAWRVGERTGVVSVARDGGAELRVLLAPKDGSRAQVTRALEVPGSDVDAVQIMAGSGTVVCARTESVSSGTGPIEVSRRLVCVDLATDTWVVDRALPPPGLYLPRREIAAELVGNRLTTLHARPSLSGLELSRCEVSL